jgi:hypothetical protein
MRKLSHDNNGTTLPALTLSLQANVERQIARAGKTSRLAMLASGGRT